uniref:Otogelin n=1 Tax=Cyprinodon variegatus TaxID=28743 RepID=A0A3Q2CIL9_CYPVA
MFVWLHDNYNVLLFLSGEPCEYPCLNGGQCILSESCDCSLFQATGHRCQTVPNLGFEREMTCRTWGQYNFETFDGLYFYFPGRCTYTLLRDYHFIHPESVCEQVHNDPDCSSAPYTCQRSVSVFLPWEGEIRLYATSTTFKGQRLVLPHRIHDLQLEQISQYVVVTQQLGFTLAWEGQSGSVYIKLSPEFVGRTCGLCGNFNADVQDDLKTSYGETVCFIHLKVSSGETSLFDSAWLQKVEEVCAMLLEPPFQSCHDFVSPLSYMASCSNDLCKSGPSGDVVCQVFSEYARACAHADHPLHNWRQHIPQCGTLFLHYTKKQKSEYRECISCCPESCNLERTCIDSKLACLDGCYCPEGLIYEDGSCVAPADCPCEYHGMFYPSGQTLQEECNNCTCVGGVWNCTDNSCPGECSVTGDMYFQSFDGRIFSFPATCQYVLAKSRNSGKFTVTIQNAPCGANLDGACIQSVNLVINEDPRTEITLSHIGEVFMAGQYRISLPYSDDFFHIQELSSMFLQVRTGFGLHLQYSWTEFRLYLQADETWKDNTVGLCGTFNGNSQDDFLSPSGMIESSPHLFGNSWKVSSACSLSLSTPQIDPCDTHQQAVTYASEMCDILNQDLFSACHEYLSPTPFHQQCRADTCRCGTPCLCSALAHYARHCRRFSVIIDFRSHISDCAVTCPTTMQYGTCVSSCQRRCSSLSVPQHCGEYCEEGCVCPQGSFYNHRTHTCVHNECPCSVLGVDYEPGDVILTSAGVQLCPPGQLYLNCTDEQNNLMPGRGLACERTCESFLLNITCSAHEPCVSGCTCPPGLLKHGDECFEPDACPCLWKGKEYFPGDRVSSPCYQCVCQHGTFQCLFRPCPSMCTSYGDRHYRTFDGLLFDYVGACKVYLVKSSADVVLNVMAGNVDCFDSGMICRKTLLINMGGSFISFDDDSGKPNPSSVIDKKQQMFIWPAGYFTIIHFPEEDVTVLWDRKTTVHIQVGPHWQGKLSGLCGNFDLKTVNEMRTPDNIDSPTPQEFGNSWTATECVNSPDIRHPCSLSPLREPFAKRQCSILLSEVFQTCHPVVDVTWFYMNCLADTCACSRGGDCECFCTSVAAYAQRCCHEGIPVDWRSPSLCLLGKGPFRLFTYRDQTTLLAASRSSGFVFLQRVNISTNIAAGVLVEFMMTPGLSRTRPHDASRISFEAVDRPNYFLHASASGQVRLTKWEDNEAFWDGATFIIHRNTWISGYDSLESHAKPGFFLHATMPRLHLLKFRHTYSFRQASLFRLSDTRPSPRCQWRYDSCISPCFKTCSDPSAESSAVPVTGKTTTSKLTSRPLVVPETSTDVIFATKPETSSHISTLPQSPATESSTHPSYTEQSSESGPHFHWETTSASTATYQPPMGTTSVLPSESPTMSSKSPEVSQFPETSRTSSTTTTTTGKTTPEEGGVTTIRKLITPPAPHVSGSLETLLTTNPTGAVLSSLYTTVKPVIVASITETAKPVTARVSTGTTNMSPPTLYSLHTSSQTAPAESTILEKVTTRLVSIPGATPTIARTSILTAASRVPVTTRVSPRATPTSKRPVTSRVTIGMRPSAITTRSTMIGSPTVSPATTSPVIATSASKTDHVSTSAASPPTITTTVLAPSPKPAVPFTTAFAAESTTTKEAKIQQTQSQSPDVFVATKEPGIPFSTTTPYGATTTMEKIHTTSGSTLSSISPHLAMETTSSFGQRSTLMTETPVRTCTVKIVDECTKYICVNNQLILFNKSQSCPFTAEPPNCGLLGFSVLINGDKCCPKWDCPCRCSIFPDLNVITFDGDSFAVFKAASYIVTQLPNETLSVLIQECPADSELPVGVFWNFTNLCLVSLNITHKSNHVVINRLQRRLYVNSRYAKPRFKKYGFEIYDTGNMYLIRSPTGLKVQWYHSTGMMVIDTDGLGFCDGDLTNDLTLPNGTVLGVSKDPTLFIDSWQVPNTTSYVSYSRRREHNCSTSDCSRCLAMLEDNTFTRCHEFVPPSTFCEVWVRDSEYMNNHCVALAAYVASCHKFNICIEWRRPDYCHHCMGLTEGCVCPEGTLLHRPYSALCIPFEKCACTDSSGVPRANGEVWKASKDGCCMYRCDNDTIVPVEYNCSSVPTPVCQRTGEMIISMSDDTSCCPHKVCLCNQSLCDHFPPECKYGEKLVSYYRADSCCPDYVCECDPELCESDIPTCRDDQTLIATRADGSCCLAHICMCSSCSETPPFCQDGEVLSVDSNSTDRCCPSYQCVCEPYRCPQLSCPYGMSVVSVSNSSLCCPKQTCGMILTCYLLLLSRNLSFFAGKCNITLCFVFTECTCDKAVCVFGERGLLQPGQTLVEHGDNGLCYSRHCSQVLDQKSGFYLLRNSTVNCSIHCQPNQIYVPPKDQSTCCGVCKNISCLYQHENGTMSLYKPGRSWVSNCKKFDCSDTSFGPTLISYSYSCPPFNETECMKIGGTVISYMDGCCKTCKEDGKSCQKVTVRMTIRKNDCRSNRPVNIVSCDGKCPSASIYNYNINTYARFCKCCRETGLQRRSVQLYCSSNATWVSYTIQEPTDCSCQWS